MKPISTTAQRTIAVDIHTAIQGTAAAKKFRLHQAVHGAQISSRPVSMK
ncbi:MAG: hypothetical protein IT184_02145 [Acidobacteria bacterium]|nr:hypothetical protein [Acidobacteriota bacterium]